MAIGIGLVGLLFLITRWGKLVVSNWLIKNFVPYLIIAVIILFQGEIRRFLTGIGSRTIRKPLALRSFQEKIDDLVMAVDYMSQRKIGALIAIENEISLETFADRGTRDRRRSSPRTSSSACSSPSRPSTTGRSSSAAARSSPRAACCPCRRPITSAPSS